MAFKLDDVSRAPSQFRVPAGDTASIPAAIARARARFHRTVDAPVYSCYEAGRGGPWLHRLLVTEDIVSLVARQHGVNPNQLFHWRKLYQDGSLSAVKAGEEVVPASELADALKQIRELQRMLGKNGMDASSSHN